MIKVHHLENSRSQRVLWLLEELELDYELVVYQRDPVTMRAPDTLRQVHPLGKSPIVEDGDNIIAESGPIIEYLTERYDTGHTLTPAPGTSAFRDCRYWLHYAEGSAMPPLVMTLIFSRLDKKPVPLILRPAGKMLADGITRTYLKPDIQNHLDFWERSLATTGYFAGNRLSVADIQMSFPVLAAASRIGISGRPALSQWITWLRSRPAWQRAVEKGGPFAY
ncbi:glutathione S-transferase [Larsenimonas rhizosphaerae]|uniref:glutathione S-transferase n=1 Tax=Larsenimonas rhizosphaerae TaxID=2944682 RepID=UPI002034A41E|nr:glutathione S-transferase [Larsenimonas rhizosphaerae]MCM2131943.1 glutathione S-transferase [Larsenimonas rhizosphaerae]